MSRILQDLRAGGPGDAGELKWEGVGLTECFKTCGLEVKTMLRGPKWETAGPIEHLRT